MSWCPWTQPQRCLSPTSNQRVSCKTCHSNQPRTSCHAYATSRERLTAVFLAGVWKLYLRWVKDSIKYNEWMNPIDYEMDDVPPAKDSASAGTLKQPSSRDGLGYERASACRLTACCTLSRP